jgi:TPR repeat protein
MFLLVTVQFVEAHSLFYGCGVSKNIPQAIDIFQQADKEGCLKSTNFLGKIYLEGLGVRKNYEKAHQVMP